MKTLLLIVPAIAALFTGCATVTPMGANLAGVDADEIEITGNYKTGEYTLKAKGLNMSTGLNVAGTTLTETTKLKILGQVGEAVIGEGGQIASDIVN